MRVRQRSREGSLQAFGDYDTNSKHLFDSTENNNNKGSKRLPPLMTGESNQGKQDTKNMSVTNEGLSLLAKTDEKKSHRKVGSAEPSQR